MGVLPSVMAGGFGVVVVVEPGVRLNPKDFRGCKVIGLFSSPLNGVLIDPSKFNRGDVFGSFVSNVLPAVEVA